MFLIKKCSRCGKNVRFPLERGKIRVKCPCGNSFIADPDDPELYKGAQFDLHGNNNNKKSGPGLLKDLFSSPFNFKKQWERAIRSFIDLTYKIQNFSILPSREQRTIILIFSFIVLAIVILLFLVCNSPFSVTHEEWNR
ncbi:MAG TPA: hypothetical protein PK544_04120 [Spirochaetota bacterium]|nr:hypothetical protein [Spirochaetota bacterium]HPJ37641.1 hypothetical protein [Spirochaetota bacterium]HPQ53981.1 hypothetical protein [Spirochaetota bacterium]